MLVSFAMEYIFQNKPIPDKSVKIL